MAAKPLPDQALLLKLLRYEPETGKLFWRERTPDLFKATKFDAITICANWNAAYAGREIYQRINQRGYAQVKLLRSRFGVDRIITAISRGTLQ